MSEDIGREYWEVGEEMWTRTRRQTDETVWNTEQIWQQKETSNTEENHPLKKKQSNCREAA